VRKRRAVNRELAESVVAIFHTHSAYAVVHQFRGFDKSDWMRTRNWLHTSGLALYFMNRVRQLGVEAVVPVALRRELTANTAENRVRTAALFDEFARINIEFQRAGILYANLKGFTLAPAACADPALRYQHDLDFLVSRRDAERCRQVLVRQGYMQTASQGDAWEFSAGAAEACTMRDLYRARSQRSVELHLVPEQEEERTDNRLARLQLQVWNGFEFPALSDCDKLLEQALHLFHHFKSEWSRTAWLLEYATAIGAHRENDDVWQKVEATLQANPEMRIGVTMASLIACRTFEVNLPDELGRTADAIPAQVRLWIDRYERELVFTEHPGSKLYLLLNDVLLDGHPEWRRQRRRRLLPMRLPAKLIVTKSDSIRISFRLKAGKMRFVLRRLWFHIATGFHYKLEAGRWRRFLAGAQM
jgi:hypothetical protein